METTEWQRATTLEKKLVYLRPLLGQKIKYALNKEVGPIVIAYDRVRDEEIPIPWHESKFHKFGELWHKPGIVVDNDTGILSGWFKVYTKTFDDLWDIQLAGDAALRAQQREFRHGVEKARQESRDAKAWQTVEPWLRTFMRAHGVDGNEDVLWSQLNTFFRERDGEQR